MGATFQIPDENLPKLRAKIEKLGKRAEKLVGSKIYLMEIGFQDNEKDNGVVERVWDVFIAGPEPKFQGYTFIARIDHTNEAGNIIRSVPGEDIPQRFRDRPGNCDHCGHNRYRRDTFLVKEDETGRVMQVGSSCLKDFVGHGDPAKFAKLAELYGYAREHCGFYGEREVGLDYRYLGLETFGAHVMAMVRLYGWTPKSRADEDNWPTVTKALDNMFPNPHEEPVEPTDEDRKYAEQAIDWALSLGENGTGPDQINDYEYNLNVIAQSGVIEMRTTGIAASLFGVWYQRNVEEAKQFVDTSNSEYVGNVKERMETRVRVLFTKRIDAFYGPCTLHKMADDNGNLLVWFNSGGGDLVKGRSYMIRGTVKGHSEYQGSKQTMLNRVKVMEGV